MLFAVIRGMGSCPDAVKRLIEHFDRQSDQVRAAEYNETQLRIDFVNPLFQQFGWDMEDRQGFVEQYREVVHEDRGKVEATDRQIDELVYKLYGLTDEEIRIVEAATAPSAGAGEAADEAGV